jgi:PhnB protein
MSVNFIPAGYHTATPYLVVRGAAAAIEFYKTVFGATEVMRFGMPDGSVAHAEIKIGDSLIMLGDENPAWGAVGPQTIGGTPVGLCLYFPDVDARFAAAVANGARVEKPVQDQFYGDRCGTVVDPFGHKWTIATHVEDVSEEEMHRRMSEFTKQGAAA